LRREIRNEIAESRRAGYVAGTGAAEEAVRHGHSHPAASEAVDHVPKTSAARDLANKLGFRTAEVPVEWAHDERSKISPLRDGSTCFGRS
jgi:hypothetical protein